MQFAAMLLVAIAAAQTAPDPLERDRALLRTSRYEQAVARYEERLKNGDCPGAVCDAGLAVALSRMKQTDRALEHAQKAVEKIDEQPPVSDWEANELGVILFRAPQRTAKQLHAAAKAFRFARTHYKGRASNITFNLLQTLQALGAKSEEASAIQRELDARLVIDQKYAILGDFQGAMVDRK